MQRFALFLLLTFGVGLAAWLWMADDEPSEPGQVIEIAETESIVVALRDLARLEGTVFHIERVIDLKEKQSRFHGLVQAEDAILLVASGDVIAGVDLSRMRAEDVRADRETGRVWVVLPPAEILVSRLDNQKTYVHTRKTDVLAKRAENLETRARQEAERSLGHAALEAGILPRAEQSVGRTVEALLRSLGYAQVDVEFRDVGRELEEGGR